MDYKQIIQWLQTYKQSTGCKGVVIGLSGGKDSTTVAMLAKKVWDKNVIAVLMPNGSQKDLNDSIDIAETLGLDYRIVNIGRAYEELVAAVENSLPENESSSHACPETIKISDKAKTNIPPRLRMNVLYSVAQSIGYRVIGTGNRSEAFIGWCTKWGDCAYDLNPIGSLTCTEVIALGKTLAKEFHLPEKYIVKAPADGLTGRTDEENIGFTYAELDNYILTGKGDPELVEKIEKMHKSSEHKRKMPVIFPSSVQ